MYTIINKSSSQNNKESKNICYFRTSKIFRIFTEYLKERTAAQCRSHYQKMIAKFKTVPQLKKYYKKHFSEERYSYEFDMFKESWELSHPKNIKA